MCFFVWTVVSLYNSRQKHSSSIGLRKQATIQCLEYEHFHRLVSAEIGLTHMTTLKDEDVDILDEDIDKDDDDEAISKRNSKSSRACCCGTWPCMAAVVVIS